MTDEEYVRANWEEVRLIWGPGNPYQRSSERLCYVAYSLPPGHECTISSGNQAEAWSAAAEFTRERMEQIRQLEEEIDCMGFYDFSDQAEAARKRILARLESALADLKRGMKA